MSNIADSLIQLPQVAGQASAAVDCCGRGAEDYFLDAHAPASEWKTSGSLVELKGENVFKP